MYTAVSIFIYSRLVHLVLNTKKQKPAKVLTEGIMKNEIIVVKEKGKLFWFCGSCGRPLARTREYKLFCPRGHIKTAAEYKKKKQSEINGQLEMNFGHVYLKTNKTYVIGPR